MTRFYSTFACFFVFAMMLSAPAAAVIETYEFETELQHRRYQDFIQELRCPKCQNQNLAGSNSPISADLRRELHRLLLEGKSDQEIVDYMVARYGDFVLYRPPVNKHTIVLWLLPVALLLLGALVVTMLVRRKAAGAAVDVQQVHQQAEDVLARYNKEEGQ